MTATIRSKRSNTHSDLLSKIVFRRIETIQTEIFVIYVDIMSHDPHPFLRMQMHNFQVDNCPYISLTNIQIQIELKEKHRTTRDNVESNIYIFNENKRENVRH